MVDFIRDSVANYAQTALAFVSDSHQLVHKFADSMTAANDSKSQDTLSHDTLRRFMALDELYETMTLNHVSRRASRAQGVALLSLYSRGFAKPAFFRGHSSQDGEPAPTKPQSDRSSVAENMGALVDKLKLTVRREETHGHLPICWGVLTTALGLSLGAMSSFVHFVYYLRLIALSHVLSMKHRTQSISAPLFVRPRSDISWRTNEHPWSICGPAIITACRASHRDRRNRTM